VSSTCGPDPLDGLGEGEAPGPEWRRTGRDSDRLTRR
jgi:hypothetical protein